MLQKLYIRNYAIIDELNIAFDEELNVITGETGAGKSIIVGALSLILGERADTSVLINRNEKSVVEAYFKTENNKQFIALLQREELDIEPVTIIRREISVSGKSRAFINDTPVTLTVLNELTSGLVDLHRQFEHRALEETRFMYMVLDAFADNIPLRTTYQDKYHQFKRLQSEYLALKENQAQWKKEADYKQFLFDELEQADFQPQEIEDAAQHLKQLGHAEQIKSSLQGIHDALEEGDQPLNSELKRWHQQLQGLSELLPPTRELAQRFESTLLELKDIALETYNLYNQVDLDPERLRALEERLDTGYRLLKKHGANTTDELIQLKNQLSAELLEQNATENTLEELSRTLEAYTLELEQAAHTLFHKRKESAPVFEERINHLLQQVGMPNALLQISLTPSEALNPFGKDHIAFLFDANKSGQFLPVQKTASGGELSRIMLCIKALTAKALELPTLIFDEVDAGISGEAAKQVGILLRSLSAYHQVLCITHQPQVAGKGTQHYYVYKIEDEAKQIKTRIRALNKEDRINAIAQMIGGTEPSEAALENARELLL